ncbi:MAG: hypothetical protein AAF611_03985 [Bacteroidota bacterium]
MKKQDLKNLKLNKSLVSNLAKNSLTGGLSWQHDRPTTLSEFPGECPPPTKTGSMCLTGYQTNCQ